MTGDLRSSILTTAAVAASVAGLTVIQPLTAAPPLLLAALLMDGDATDYTGIADTIQGKLLPADGKAVIVNFLTGPFGIWNALDGTGDPDEVVPSTALGVASSIPFMAPPATSVIPAQVPPALAPPAAPVVPVTIPGPVLGVGLPNLELGDAILVPPPPPPWTPTRPVVTSFEYDLGSYATATLLNPFAWTNSMAAYLERTLTGAVVPVNPDGSVGCDDGAAECHVPGGVISQFTDANGVTHIRFTTDLGAVVEATVETRDGVTYVTYDDEGALPLVRPLRDYGGLLGNELADVLEPALTALVYWGYRDAIGDDDNPLLPSIAETIRAVLDFVVGVKEGLESLLEAHEPATSTLAQAVPTDDAELDADVSTPEPADQPAGPSTPEPLKPAPISVDDAVGKLTGLFEHRAQPDVRESADDDVSSDKDVPSDDDAEGEGDTGADGTGGDTGQDGTDGDTDTDTDDEAAPGGTDDDADKDDTKPDRVKGSPNGTSDDSADSAGDKDSAAQQAPSQ